MSEDLISISKKIADFSPVILSIALILGFAFFKKLNSLTRSLLIYVGILLVSDLLVEVFAHYWHNSLLVLYIYCFAELAFMLFFYKKYMFRNKQHFLTILGFAGLAYIVMEMLLIFVFKGLEVKQFQPYAKVVDNFIIILLALTYLNERMSRYREHEWGNFRLNIVFLVFFTLNALFFLPFNFMVNASNIKFYFWTGHIIFLILFYLYLTFEILRNGLKGTSASSAPQR